jgi:hypothetical protein
MLLWIPHRPVSSHLHRQGAGDQSVLSQNELRVASSAFPRNRAGPLELFATHWVFLITDDDGPPWLDYRGPPGPDACSHQDLGTSCKAASQVSSLRWRAFQQNSGRINIGGFATAFS